MAISSIQGYTIKLSGSTVNHTGKRVESAVIYKMRPFIYFGETHFYVSAKTLSHTKSAKFHRAHRHCPAVCLNRARRVPEQTIDAIRRRLQTKSRMQTNEKNESVRLMQSTWKKGKQRFRGSYICKSAPLYGERARLFLPVRFGVFLRVFQSPA